METKTFDKNGLTAYKCMNRFEITGFELKLIAVITMLIDHLANFYVTSETATYVLRSIGRISFPIYCFLIVEGFNKTTNIKKYINRLLLFAIISEIPYDLAFSKRWIYNGKTNVFWTLLIGLITIYAIESLEKNKNRIPKRISSVFGMNFVMIADRLIILCVTCYAAECIKATYSYAGVLLIYMFYALYRSHIGSVFANFCFNVILYGGMQSWGLVSSVFISLYNGERGNNKFKMLFYWIYPLHLIAIVLINYLLVRIF